MYPEVHPLQASSRREYRSERSPQRASKEIYTQRISWKKHSKSSWWEKRCWTWQLLWCLVAGRGVPLQFFYQKRSSPQLRISQASSQRIHQTNGAHWGTTLVWELKLSVKIYNFKFTFFCFYLSEHWVLNDPRKGRAIAKYEFMRTPVMLKYQARRRRKDGLDNCFRTAHRVEKTKGSAVIRNQENQ